jgi:hypothetical protein
MNRYLVIENDLVTNVVVWDGESEWIAPDGAVIEQAEDHIGIGWRKVDGQWIAPEPLVLPSEDPTKVSAGAKLAALGLTEEEIATLLR